MLTRLFSGMRAIARKIGARVTALSCRLLNSSADDSANSRRSNILHCRHRHSAREHRDRDRPLPPKCTARRRRAFRSRSRKHRAPALRNRQLRCRYAASTFQLDYPDYEILFCVAAAKDAVVPLVTTLMAAHPGASARLLVGDDRVSPNPKLNNVRQGLARRAP